MNFRSIFSLVLISVSPLFAMDFHDSMMPQSRAATRLHAAEQHAAAQRLLTQKAQLRAQYVQEEKEKASQRAAILGDAFAQLPNNKSRTQKEKDDFYAAIATRMPRSVQCYIGQFKGKNNVDFIDEHLMELIPCIVKKRAFYPNMKKLIVQGCQRLNNYYQDHVQQLVVRDQPYILAAVGFWSFDDEPSVLRERTGARNFASDVNRWFRLTYPNNAIKHLANDEWLAVLYSDGSIKWKISPFNSASLKKLSKEQLLLGAALWEQPDFLQSNELELYRALPACITKAMQSNYIISSSREAKQARKIGRAIVAAGALCAIGYWAYLNGKPVVFSVSSEDRGIRCISKGLFHACAAMLPAEMAFSYSTKMGPKMGRDVMQPANWHERRNYWFKVGGKLLWSTATFVVSMILGSALATYRWNSDISFGVER